MNFNHVFVSGELVEDANCSVFQGTTRTTHLAVMNLLNKTPKKKADGSAYEEMLWIDIKAWGDLAQECLQKAKKGTIIFVEGTLKKDSWDDKTTGTKKSKIVVNASKINFLNAVSEEAIPSDFKDSELPF